MSWLLEQNVPVDDRNLPYNDQRQGTHLSIVSRGLSTIETTDL